MSDPAKETLTAALRRLADEGASGLLAVDTTGGRVVLEVRDGTPVAIGPTHDVAARVGPSAASGLVTAAVVDNLLDRMVSGIVHGEGAWTWDVASDDPRVPVPDGFATELKRRAVDAAHAMSRMAPTAVLAPGRPLEVRGEVAGLLGLFDGSRTLAEVADASRRSLATIATMAEALVAAGALATGQDDVDPVAWTDAAAEPGTNGVADAGPEPELWVMDDEPEARLAAVEPAAVEPTAGEPAPGPTSARADRSDDEAWDDTSWMEGLDDPLASTSTSAAATPIDEDPEPQAAGGSDADDARAALSAMLRDSDEATTAASRRAVTSPTGDEGEPAPQDEADEAASSPASRPRRSAPRAEPGEVAEFLRELSRLALDDD